MGGLEIIAGHQQSSGPSWILSKGLVDFSLISDSTVPVNKERVFGGPHRSTCSTAIAFLLQVLHEHRGS